MYIDVTFNHADIFSLGNTFIKVSRKVSNHIIEQVFHHHPIKSLSKTHEHQVLIMSAKFSVKIYRHFSIELQGFNE